jgi:hypothetical protein
MADTGTTTSLLDAAITLQRSASAGPKIACLEEVALHGLYQPGATFGDHRSVAEVIRDYLQMVCDEGPSSGPEPVG